MSRPNFALYVLFPLLVLSSPAAGFEVVGATISSALKALSNGEVSCVEFIQAHIDRIKTYDKTGPALTSITNFAESAALEKAKALDDSFMSTGNISGRVYCMPILAKDDYDHVDFPTTSSSVTMEACYPAGTSSIIASLEQEGAIMLGKTNLPDFTVGNADVMSSTSTLIGATKNAYVSSRSPYGSSGGTGAAIAASFSVIGLAADTQGSIQMPAACEGMIGIRPTQDLTAHDNQFPLVIAQDSNGPISRTVEDAAIILELIVNQTVVTQNGVDASYTKYLDKNGLSGKRIGFSRDVLSTVEIAPGVWYAPDENVVRAADKALNDMSKAGAIIVDNVNIASALSEFLNKNNANTTACGTAWNRYGITAYLETSPLDSCPIKTIQDIIDTGVYPPGDDTRAWLDAMVDYPMSPFEDPACASYEQMKTDGESLVLSMMADAGVDYILYPVFNRLPTLMDPDPSDPLNMPYTFLSASTRMPSLTFPVGYGDEDGIPISLSLTGPRYSEAELISLAYGYEQQFFSNVYRSTDNYPPLTESDDKNDDGDDLDVAYIIVIVLACLAVVSVGVIYYLLKSRMKANPEGSNDENTTITKSLL